MNWRRRWQNPVRERRLLAALCGRRQQPPLREFSASRQAAPVRRSCCGGRRFATTALWCSPRGRADNSLRALAGATFKQYRRVRSRSALRAPTPALRSSSPQKSPLPGVACREVVARLFSPKTTSAAAKTGPGRLRCASEAPRSAGPMASARSAPRALTSSRLFERSERSSRSELATRPWARASQGTPPTGRGVASKP